MSFARPNVSSRFETLQSFFLWFQMGYSVWQFVRTAKFLRLPYVMFSSLWNGCDSWIKTRKLIMMRDDLDLDQDYLPSTYVNQDYLRNLPNGMAILDVGDDHNVEVSFTDSYTCLTNRHRAAHMKLLRVYHTQVQFGRDDDVLLPEAHLIRRLSFEQAMDHVLGGKGYDILPATECFFDWSSKHLVNQNFVRFASIWPLILQARRYDFWSVILSVLVILMDVFSFWANKLWRWVQFWTSRLVKWSISRVSSRERRRFLFTFMATISSQFYCRNFVTDEASSKLVKQVLLATHTKVDKGKIDELRSVQCTKEVPRKDRTQSSAQKISVSIGGVAYEAKTEPALDEDEPSSIFFRKQNIKVGDWRVEDMAYFLQVCEFCDQFKCPPIKSLCERNNAECCSFAEVVQGVRTRSFVLCEFKKAQRLFVT